MPKICWKNNVLWSVSLVVLLASATTADADTAAELPASDCMELRDCVTMVQSARRLSDANQLNAARQTYESAYARWPSPWLLINIGRIQQKLGNPAEAITNYHRYLDSATNDKPERVAAARGFLMQAEQDLATKRFVADIVITRPAEKPIYKKWWFWTTIGAVAVAAGAITTGVVLSTREVVPNGIPGDYNIRF